MIAMPEMIPVKSTCVQSLGYNPVTAELYVRFLESNQTYVYENVDVKTFLRFLSADSKGEFFSQEIRSVFSDYRRIG
jgi:KTSC domain-containing protein